MEIFKVKELLAKIQSLVDEDEAVLEMEVWLNSGEYSCCGASVEVDSYYSEAGEDKYLNLW